MADGSRSRVIKANPIGKGLDTFRDSFEFQCRGLAITGANALYYISGEGPKNSLLDLIHALQGLSATCLLPLNQGNRDLLSDLLSLSSAVYSDNFDIKHILPLLRAVLNTEPNELHNIGSFTNSTKHRKYMDGVLKEELGQLYVRVSSFFNAYFRSVPEGDNPLYQQESGWQGWPEGAKECNVLSWFTPLTSQLLDFAAEIQPASRPQRRPLAQPHQPIQGSTANYKLDVGFVDNPSAGIDSKCCWSQILIPGELKRRYTREEFNRLGGIASEQFNINKDGLQFVSAVLRFLWLNEEQLGFDPTIITARDKQYIKIERDTHTERLVIDEVVKRVPYVADNSRISLVIKDSWQFPERKEEGELLREATEKDVVNVARYYHHETVCVGGQNDDIRGNVQRGLDITNATNYRPESSMLPPSMAGRRVSRIGQSSSVTGRKRSSSCTDASLPPTKRTCSISPTKGERAATANRVHRRVIVRDYGKAIYKASSRTSLLAALEGCIEGYESLHTRAGMLQRDISPNNLMMNEEDDEEPHSFMHDLESFFWVLFWICIHYSGSQERVVPRFDKWNFADTEELATMKLGIVSDNAIFHKTAQEYFTEYYQPLIPYVNRLRGKVFPINFEIEREHTERSCTGADQPPFKGPTRPILERSRLGPEHLGRPPT
ncbi:hypothetical protein P154DRAFT_550100 [Amniculicola lignicola CBS 123094]|uniref:Fungal-type protein kinase domain-containing protein n=1 Tax=Amniculicola lignicola CBS 123094 TaxID=1392246 RepID=A0A6A5X4R0_9PLEO|nr:hypothetical protein P154DRAFT_550100 [Amniculicola lignicola CBS 123094]